MTEADLELVLGWRNHPAIRSVMYGQALISADDHARWFAVANAEPSRVLLIFEHGGKPSGYNSITRVRHGDVAEWGYYMAPDAPSGSGGMMGLAILEHAFAGMGLHRLYAETMASNERAIRFNLKLGFRREGVLRDHAMAGGHRVDVHCFGLLADEWKSAGGRDRI